MTRISIVASVLLALGALPALAETPKTRTGPFSFSTSLPSNDLKTTPEMWFYEQEKQQYEDPKAAVRRNAEQKAAQRMARLGALKWFGLSNIRPQCTVTPGFDIWSPLWRSNNTFFGSEWNGVGGPYIIAQPAPSPSLRRY
jgi:hypothetical protein